MDDGGDTVLVLSEPLGVAPTDLPFVFMSARVCARVSVRDVRVSACLPAKPPGCH